MTWSHSARRPNVCARTGRPGGDFPGRRGVNWFAAEGAWQARPPAVEVASTVGAGDSLLAGMLHGLASGWPAERVLRQATAIASLAVTQFEFGIGDPQRLARIEAGVVVQPLVEEA